MTLGVIIEGKGLGGKFNGDVYQTAQTGTPIMLQTAGRSHEEKRMPQR